MKANVGTIDRAIRIVVGLGLIGATLGGFIGVWGWLGTVSYTHLTLPTIYSV